MFPSMIFGTSQGEICDPSLQGMAVWILGPRSTPRGRWKALDGVRRSWGLRGPQPNSLSLGAFFRGWKCLGCRIFCTIPIAPCQSTTLHMLHHLFFMFTLIWWGFPFWLIFFRWGWFNYHLVHHGPPTTATTGQNQVSTPRHSFWSHAWRGESNRDAIYGDICWQESLAKIFRETV